MKKLSCFSCLVLVVFLLFGVLPKPVHAVGSSFDANTKTLTISGSGPISNKILSPYVEHVYSKEAEKIVIEPGITYIGERSFMNFRKLKEVSIPDTVTGIGDHAFYDCTFTEIYIPSSVTEIGRYAFCSSNLMYASIPSQVIGEGAFSSCNDLISIKFTAENVQLGIDTVANCENLENVILENGAQSIPDGFVRSCKKLKGFVIPDGVASVGSNAFRKCGSLTYIEIPASVTSFGEEVFENCSALEAVVLPPSLTEIPEQTFAYCYNLKRVYLPSALKQIDALAFNGCTALTAIKFPEGVESIGVSAFYDCTALQHVSFPSTLLTIEDYAFSRSGLQEAILPDSLTQLGVRAFSLCANLESVKLSNSMTDISEDAFASCKKLTHLTLPASIKTLSSGAFEQCDSMVYIHCMGDFPEYTSAWYRESREPVILYYNEGTNGWTGHSDFSLNASDTILKKWEGEADPIPVAPDFEEPAIMPPAKPEFPQHKEPTRLSSPQPTIPPATQPPTTQPPTTQPPTTQPPATQPPATQPPATQPPATQAPTTAESNGSDQEPDTFSPILLWSLIAVVLVAAGVVVIIWGKNRKKA